MGLVVFPSPCFEQIQWQRQTLIRLSATVECVSDLHRAHMWVLIDSPGARTVMMSSSLMQLDEEPLARRGDIMWSSKHVRLHDQVEHMCCEVRKIATPVLDV